MLWQLLSFLAWGNNQGCCSRAIIFVIHESRGPHRGFAYTFCKKKKSASKIILEQESQLLEIHMGISSVWGNRIHKTHFELKLCGKQFTLLWLRKNNLDFLQSFRILRQPIHYHFTGICIKKSAGGYIESAIILWHNYKKGFF